MRSQLLTIGRFARLSGLSEGALRHYDELGLLTPAETDGTTGYRRYAQDQLDRARDIAALRAMELPLDDIAVLIATADPGAREPLLRRHRARLEARQARAVRVRHRLWHAMHEEARMSKVPAPEFTATEGRARASTLFNRTWELLELEDRTAAQDDELIHTAHASRYHWAVAAPEEPARLARGEWMCARVYATLGRSEPALWHARRCHEIASGLPLGDVAAGGRADWDLAAACEGLARAFALAGDRATAERWASEARRELESIANAEDRRLIEGDLAAIDLGD